VARPLRLRHKLVLGLVLVIASIGLLLGGALLGLSSYVYAGQVVDNKLSLIQVVVILRDRVHMLAVGGDRPRTREEERDYILSELAKIRQDLATFRMMRASARTLDTTDPDNGEGIDHYENEIEKLVAELDASVRRPAAGVRSQGDRRIIDEPDIRERYNRLARESTELFTLLRSHVSQVNEWAAANHKRGMAIASSATALSIILVLTLLYYFRAWVFRPIRLLQEGVRRVHQGDFDKPIQLKSEDELQELADEFDAMTKRMRAVYTDLANQVNERSRQLVRSERMVSVGFLAAGVAHEINNPLASIAFSAEAMERRLQELAANAKPAEAQAVAKYLQVIQQEAFRCKQITQKLLDFSRTGGKREPADLGRLVQDVIDVTRVLPPHRNKSVQFTPVPLTASVSTTDIKSVVLNLVVNSLESMDDGGVLAISLTRDGEQAVLTFRDTGCGMSGEVLENIFEPFFTRRRTGNGTGLGLSISHQIIDAHGGSIAAASDGPGRGSTFIVRLPLRGAETGPATVPFPNRPLAVAA
jgi:two-component system, NtrC family, sensor kinase